MEAQLRKLIQTQPDNPQAYNALGYSLADRNQRLQEADKLVEKASSLAPNDAFIMDSVGWVKYRMGDTSDALKFLRKAYDLQPNAEIGAHLGEVLWKTGAAGSGPRRLPRSPQARTGQRYACSKRCNVFR